MQGLLVWSPVRELRSHTPQNNSAHEPQLLSPLTTTRIGMSQQKIPWNTTKILHPATKTWCNQVNKYFKKRYHVFPKKSGKPLIDSGVLVKYWVCGWKCVQFEWRFIAQFSSVTQWCLTFCDPTNCSTSGLPIHHQLPELSQSHVHRVGDAIQPSHPLSFSSLPAKNWLFGKGLMLGNTIYIIFKYQNINYSTLIDFLTSNTMFPTSRYYSWI